jgi:hypothetical protein
VNPPGTYTNGQNAIENCPNGTYAPGWARRTACTPCGPGIFSEELTVDERDSSRRVSAQPTDCCKFAWNGKLTYLLVLNLTHDWFICNHLFEFDHDPVMPTSLVKAHGMHHQHCEAFYTADVKAGTIAVFMDTLCLLIVP